MPDLRVKIQSSAPTSGTANTFYLVTNGSKFDFYASDTAGEVRQLDAAGVSTFLGLTDTPSSFAGQALKVLQVNAGETALDFVTLSGGGDALTSNPLSQFAATTSLQLKGVISDETGSGALVFATSPTLVTPNLGTPSAGDLSNCSDYPEAEIENAYNSQVGEPSQAEAEAGTSTTVRRWNALRIAQAIAAQAAAAAHTHAVADLSDASANARTLIQAANYAAMRALLDLEAGTDFYSISAADAAFAAASHTHPVADLSDASANGRSLISAADYAAMRTLLGLGALATQTNVNNDDWSGADLEIANGGTGASTASAARTNLGLGALAVLGTVGTSQIDNSAVTLAKMANLTNQRLIVGNGSTPAEGTISSVLDWLSSTRGAVLYRGASGWSALSPGTNGHVLTSNGAGADPSYQAAGGGGGGAWTYISTTTISADSTVDFTGLASSVAGYAFYLDRVKPATDTQHLQLTLSDDNGSTFASTLYCWAHNARQEGGIGDAQSASDTVIRLTSGTAAGNQAGEDGVSGWVVLLGADDATSYPTVLIDLAYWDSSSGRLTRNAGVGGRNADFGVDAVRFAFASGNLDSGKIHAYSLASS